MFYVSIFLFFYAELIEMSAEVDDSFRVSSSLIVVRFSTHTTKKTHTPTVIIATDLK